MANIKLVGLALILSLLLGCGLVDRTIVEADPATLATPTATAVAPTPAHTATSSALSAGVAPDTAVTTHLVAGERSIGDPYAPELGNTGYDVLRYTLRVALDPARPYELAGTAVIDAAVALDDLGELSLDFVGFEIDELLVNGQPANFRREEGKLVITLPQPLASEEQFQLTIRYQGKSEQVR
ncbi:MAG: hypothetical protein KF770_32980, partial [Anaerolineae bacterium]|nr:hypothetical protein [Anaerolineae bacterium]